MGAAPNIGEEDVEEEADDGDDDDDEGEMDDDGKENKELPKEARV